MRFEIYLDNKQIYLMEIDFNFEKYKIKKGYLYKGFKKLGKIICIETLKYGGEDGKQEEKSNPSNNG